MNRKQRAVFIANRLQEMYPNPRVPLNHKNSFTLLIAVLLSAQCTDERVNIVTKELFKVASSASSICATGEVPVLIPNIPFKSLAFFRLTKLF